MNESLVISSLQNAVQSLTKSCEIAQDLTIYEAEMGKVIRAGVIQNFEFTYELCWKFMKRWLEMNNSAASVDGVTRRELFRLAAEYQLIDDVSIWMEFHYARNRTSHIYDEQEAQEVFAIALQFLPLAQDFTARLGRLI